MSNEALSVDELLQQLNSVSKAGFGEYIVTLRGDEFRIPKDPAFSGFELNGSNETLDISLSAHI